MKRRIFAERTALWPVVFAAVVFWGGAALAGSENVELFMEQLSEGPDAVTVSLSEMSSDELLELTERAAPVLLKEGESGRTMAGILEALSTSWGDNPPADTISAMITNKNKDSFFRWSLIECFGARRGGFSDDDAALLLEDLAEIVGDDDDDGIVRRKAAITISLLDKSGEDVRSALIDGLGSTDLRVVEGCAYGLRNIGNKQNAGPLLDALAELEQQAGLEQQDGSGDFADRQFANTLCQVALALGEQQDAMCVETLNDLLRG